MPSGGRTLGQLNRGGLEEISELTTDPPPLQGRRLGHCVDQHCRSRDVLASAIEGWGLLTPFVVMDAVVHIAGPLSGSPAFAMTSLFLFESI